MTRRTRLALVALAAATACEPPAFLQPAPARAWPATLEYAQKSATAGRYTDADSSLSAFARRFPRSPLRHPTEQAASTADSARTLADSALTLADSARVAHALRDRYVAAEVRRLRDSLEKVLVELGQTNQELDRIKRRLVEPNQ